MQLSRFFQVKEDAEIRSSLSSFSMSFFATFTVFLYKRHFFLNLVVLLCSLALSVCINNGFYDARRRWISLQAAFLGGIFSLSVLNHMTSDVEISMLSLYVACVSFFHYGEFLGTALNNRPSLKVNSYLLDQSKAYWIAHIASLIEFKLESLLFPMIKSFTISYFGFLLMFMGDIIRKLAMYHAKSGFTHIVAERHRPEHKLVTNGIYSCMRHPGYVGWLIWCIASQFVLCNPLCLVIFPYVGWKFFDERIYWEELGLIIFFGPHYIDYQNKVPTGIPFIKGYIHE